MQFGSKLPASIEALLEPSVDRAATVPMWKAFRKVYRSEKDAIAAAEKNVIPILSFINTEANIRENWKVLQEKFDKEEACEWSSFELGSGPVVFANQPTSICTDHPRSVR